MSTFRTNTLREDPELRQQANTECEVINVSPFTAPIEIGNTPGSPPRRNMLRPGEKMLIQAGYAYPFLSPSRREVQPTIERLTEREAWPGVRRELPTGGFEWVTHAGPRLPMVVRLERANEVAAQWSVALEQRRAAQSSPLKFQLKRADGSSVDAEVVPDAPEPKFRDTSSAKPTRAAAEPEVDDYTDGRFDPDPDADVSVPITLPAEAKAAAKVEPPKGGKAK